MKNKALIVFLLVLGAVIIAGFFVTEKVDAHSQDYLSGNYISTAPSKQNNLKLRIHESAVNATLTSAIYTNGTAWNNKHCANCSHIKVSISVVPDSIPALNGYYDVYGQNLNTSTQNILGVTIEYDANNNIVSASSNWHHIVIKMNTAQSTYSNSYCSKSVAAQKTFLHEIGHAFKLDHPSIGTSAIGHYINGHPVAIMNQGFPNGADVSSSIESHDIDNLRAKWGY